MNNALLKNTKIGDVLIDSTGKIAKTGNISDSASYVIDCAKYELLPAFVDMHTHLREPGQTHKEDILSAQKAGVCGGYYTLCAMANTTPVCDDIIVLDYIKNKSAQAGLLNVLPICAITKGLSGNELVDFNSLSQNGAIAFSNDGNPVTSPQTMRYAMQYASENQLLIISHSEDKELSLDGVMHECLLSTKLGLKGIASLSEEVGIARDILIAKATGAKLHIAHVSTKGGVEIVRQAKKSGVNVTAETCPHYFNATFSLVEGYNTLAKVNPPLRGEEDVLAIIEGLKDGTIDVIATDHAPHSATEKDKDFNSAPFGISGLETAFALSYELVKAGHLTLEQLSKLLTYNACNILSINPPQIKVGEVANIAIVHCGVSEKIDATNFYSKGKNTPFDKKNVSAKVVATISNGVLKYLNGEIK